MKLLLDWANSEAKPVDEKIPNLVKETFALACIELGLDKISEGVNMTFRYSAKDKLHELINSEKSDSAVWRIAKQLEDKLKISKIHSFDGGGYTSASARHPIKMKLIVDGPREILFTICHELIHVQQMVSGRLKYDQVADSITFDGVTYSKAKLDKMGPADSPPEPEAYSKGPKIALKVIRQLSDENLEFVAFSDIGVPKQYEK